MSILEQIMPRRAARSALTRAFSGLWLVDNPQRVQALASEAVTHLAMFGSAAEVRAAKVEIEDQRAAFKGFEVIDSVAHIPVFGSIMKEVPFLLDFFGIEATSTIQTRIALDKALADPSVKSIMLDIDSPGGTLDGLVSLADDIFQARDIKPIHAFAEDLAASAAFWIGSQATTFTAGTGAGIGSIGVFTAIDDFSAAFEAEGVKTHVIASGPEKGIGVMGSEVTKDQLSALQREIDAAADLFIEQVARGREMSAADVRKLATGRLFLADEAHKEGLIDGIENDRSAHLNAKITVEPGGDGENMSDAKEAAVVGLAADDSRLIELEKTVSEQKQALEELKERAEKAEAQASMVEASLKSFQKKQISSVLDAHQARGAFDPTERGGIEEQVAEVYGSDPEGLDKYLARIPSLDKKEPSGQGPTNTPDAQTIDPQLASYGNRIKLTVEDLRTSEATETLSVVDLFKGGAE